MSIPSPFQPGLFQPWHVLRRTDHDAAALLSHQPGGAVGSEIRGSAEHAHLDGVIDKPWGRELRVYDDHRRDVWCLDLDPGTSTSVHAHIRKRTYLIGLGGAGVLTTIDGARFAIEAGFVIQIEPGVLHATRALGSLGLLEVEVPPDKLDLVRLADRYARTGTSYEGAGVVPHDAPPLVPVLDGLPAARLRRRCASGRFGFAIETGAAVRNRPARLVVAISLDASAGPAPVIAGSGALSALEPAQAHLTVRERRG